MISNHPHWYSACKRMWLEPQTGTMSSALCDLLSAAMKAKDDIVDAWLSRNRKVAKCKQPCDGCDAYPYCVGIARLAK